MSEKNFKMLLEMTTMMGMVHKAAGDYEAAIVKVYKDGPANLNRLAFLEAATSAVAEVIVLGQELEKLMRDSEKAAKNGQ